jgi:lysophospholipase L1-like esterase
MTRTRIALLVAVAFVAGVGLRHFGPRLLAKPPAASPYEDATLINHRQQRAAILAQRTSHPDVIALGDSITEAGDWSDILPGVSVGNYGIGGDRSPDVLARLDTVISARPKVVALLIGTNDLAWSKLPRAAILDTIGQIVGRLRQAGIAVVLQALPPSVISPDVASFNAGLADVASAMGAPLVNAQLSQTDLFPDGIHPNAMGKEKMRAALAGQLAALLGR